MENTQVLAKQLCFIRGRMVSHAPTPLKETKCDESLSVIAHSESSGVTFDMQPKNRVVLDHLNL